MFGKEEFGFCSVAPWFFAPLVVVCTDTGRYWPDIQRNIITMGEYLNHTHYTIVLLGHYRLSLNHFGWGIMRSTIYVQHIPELYNKIIVISEILKFFSYVGLLESIILLKIPSMPASLCGDKWTYLRPHKYDLRLNPRIPTRMACIINNIQTSLFKMNAVSPNS